MQALKSLVIGLGVLILIGMGLLVYGIYQKARNQDFALFSTAQKAEPPAQPPRPFGTVGVSLPEGCVITEMRPAQDRLFLLIGPSGAPCERIVIIDLKTGATLGTVAVTP